MRFTATASGLHDRSADGGGFTPEISALFSNTFADDRAGIALSVVRQERESGTNTGRVDGWGATVGLAEWGGIPLWRFAGWLAKAPFPVVK